MAAHGERPDGRDPAQGRFGYLSSLGLDDGLDDGFDDSLDDALTSRRTDDRAGAWDGGRAEQAQQPDDDGAGQPPEPGDPTAAWALPQVEEPVAGAEHLDPFTSGLAGARPDELDESPAEGGSALEVTHDLGDAHLAEDAAQETSVYQAEPRPDAIYEQSFPGPAFPETSFPETSFPERSFPEPADEQPVHEAAQHEAAGHHGEEHETPSRLMDDSWPEPLPSQQESGHEPRPAEQTAYRVQEPGRSSSEHLNAEMLTADTVLRSRAPRPTRGWRRTLYTASGGRVNLGLSPAERRERELIARARTPLSGCHRLAVISLKGGVGKTTTTAALGAMFASLRGDRVVAVDANPDRGTLGERVPRESTATVRDLLDARDRLTRYADVRQFTSQSATRLEVIASDADPGVSQAFSEADYRDTVSILERFYNLLLTDCGTGLLHSAMQGILGLADSLVIVSSASLDGARSAAATLDWLEAHGFADVVRRAVTVISTVRPGGGSVDVDRLEDHFSRRCRSVVPIPYDAHLEAGGVLDLDELAPATREAYYELAAEVGEGFAGASRRSAVR